VDAAARRLQPCPVRLLAARISGEASGLSVCGPRRRGRSRSAVYAAIADMLLRAIAVKSAVMVLAGRLCWTICLMEIRR